MPNNFVPTVGARFHLDSRPHFDGFEAEVLDLEPMSLLRCRWTIDGVPTTVTIRLQADGDDTLLELEHARLTPTTGPGFDDGWDQKLTRDLPAVLSGARDRTRVRMENGLVHHVDHEEERSARAERNHGGTDPTERDT